MISTRVVARTTGDKASERPILPITATQPLQELRFPGLAHAYKDGAMTLYTGGQGAFYFDPPAGGFAAGDILLDLPAFLEGAQTTIVAPTTVDLTRGFAPGIYDVKGEWILGSTWAIADQASITLQGAAANPSNLGAGQPWQTINVTGGVTPTSVKHFGPFTIAADNPWRAIFWMNTAVDTSRLAMVILSIVPQVLFDAAGNVF